MKFATPAARAAMARVMTEDELLTGIMEAAELYGWRYVHLGGDQRGIYRGHRGLPDLVLARRGRTLYLELKSMAGQLSRDQLAWLQAIDPDRSPWSVDQLQGALGAWSVADALKVSSQPFCALVRPIDYDAILELLK